MSPHRLSKASHWLKRFHFKTLYYYANLQLTYQNNRILLFAKTSGFDLNRIQNLPKGKRYTCDKSILTSLATAFQLISASFNLNLNEGWLGYMCPMPPSP